MKKKYPISLFISGVVDYLRLFALMGVVGLCFLIFGFLGRILLLKIGGVAAVVFYLAVAVVNSARGVSELMKRVSSKELESLLELGRHYRKKGCSFYERVMLAAEDPTGAALQEEEKPNERASHDESQPYQPMPSPAKKFVFFVGILFVAAGVYFAASAVATYVGQRTQSDWVVAEAAVTEVNARKESRGGSNSHKVTVYDISYEYSTNQGICAGTVAGSSLRREQGEKIVVKYDPEAPECSTDVLEPNTDILIVNLVYSVAFAGVGMWLSGLLTYLWRSRKYAASCKKQVHRRF